MRSAKELMTTSVPKAQPDETVGVALKRLREQKPEEASHLYLIDEASVLTSQVPIERLIAAAPETSLAICVAIRRSKSGVTTMPRRLRYSQSSAMTQMWRWLTINEGLSAQSQLAGCSGFCTRSTLMKSCAEQV